MSNSPSPEKQLLKTVLEPLLEDFQHWFSRAQILLESDKLPFLTESEHSELLAKVKQAQREVGTAQMLFKATDGQVGIEARMLVPWHQLVAQCWDLSLKSRSWKDQIS